jgi:hypothetical protein
VHRYFTNTFSDTVTGAKTIKVGFIGAGKVISFQNRGILVQFPTKDESVCVKNNQLDAQLILGKFRQPLHVSGVSRPIIRRYNRVYTKIGTYYSF